MNKELKAENAKASARRRLVRGVFSAPAALTLYSGSVAAASVTCIAKQLTNPITTNGDATLVRVPLYFLANGGNRVTFVRYDEVASLTMLLAPPLGGTYLGSGQSQCVGKIGAYPAYTVGDIYSTPAGLGITSPAEYVAVRVSATGKIEGVLGITSAGGDTALHTTCWTSFGGLAPFQ